MTGQLPVPKQGVQEVSVTEPKKVVKEEPQDEESITVLNDVTNPRREKGVKRRSVQYMDYFPNAYMPYPVYGGPPSKMAHSSQMRSHMPPSMGYPMSHGMAPLFPYAPGLPMPHSSGVHCHMPPDMMNPQMMIPDVMMHYPYRLAPHQVPTPGGKYILIDPSTGKQEVYTMVKADEAQTPNTGYSKNQRTSSSRASVVSSVGETASSDVPVETQPVRPSQKRLITPFTFPSLITMALINSPGRKATVSAVYAFIIGHFRGFSEASAHWKNSVRQCLSYAFFAKIQDDDSDDASTDRGVEWTVAQGRLGQLMEDVRQVVENNRSTPEKLQMYNIDNLDDMICGELGSRTSRVGTGATHPRQTTLSTIYAQSRDDRLSTETSSTLSAPPVPSHGIYHQARIEDDDEEEDIVIEEV